jgi:hypothetical protein
MECSGNAVALYGATSTNHGLYSVALDNGGATKYNGTASVFRPGTLLVGVTCLYLPFPCFCTSPFQLSILSLYQDDNPSSLTPFCHLTGPN